MSRSLNRYRVEQRGLDAELIDQPRELSARLCIASLVALAEDELVLHRMFEAGQFGDAHLVTMRFQSVWQRSLQSPRRLELGLGERVRERR